MFLLPWIAYLAMYRFWHTLCSGFTILRWPTCVWCLDSFLNVHGVYVSFAMNRISCYVSVLTHSVFGFHDPPLSDVCDFWIPVWMMMVFMFLSPWITYLAMYRFWRTLCSGFTTLCWPTCVWFLIWWNPWDCQYFSWYEVRSFPQHANRSHDKSPGTVIGLIM